MNIPTLENYCPGTTPGNALSINLGTIKIWYSYTTPVAFKGGGFPMRLVRENDWGPTTGKHLKAIDGGDKASRIPGQQFETLLIEALSDAVPADTIDLNQFDPTK